MKKYVLFLLLVAGLWSCDDFLTVRPKSQISETDLFSTFEGCEEAIYGVYASMGVVDLYGFNLRCGYIEVMGQSYKVQAQHDAVMVKKFEMTNDLRKYMGDIWKKMYEVIGYNNNLIAALENKASKAMPHYNLYMGEALGIRAFLLFDLVRMFAPHVERNSDARGIPYVKKWTVGVTPFSTVKEVYANLISDLKTSESYLLKGEEEIKAKQTDFTENRYIHFNLQAAQATLARVYWMKGDLDSACIYAEKVIESNAFALVTSSKIELMHAGVVGCDETIFGIFTTDLMKYYRQSFFDVSLTSAGNPNYLPREDYSNLYKAEANGNEARLNWYREPESAKDREEEGVKKEKYFMKFFTELQLKSTSFFSMSSDKIGGFGLIKLPEMYLIASEALLNKDPAKALLYFDTFIHSRGLTKFSDREGDLKKDLTVDEIYKERTKEFIGDGQSFFEMKKFLKSIPNKVLTDKDYTFVIPDEEFDFRTDEVQVEK